MERGEGVGGNEQKHPHLGVSGADGQSVLLRLTAQSDPLCQGDKNEPFLKELSREAQQ